MDCHGEIEQADVGGIGDRRPDGIAALERRLDEDRMRAGRHQADGHLGAPGCEHGRAWRGWVGVRREHQLDAAIQAGRYQSAAAVEEVAIESHRDAPVR